eukprot:CAMPEP_0168728724 /NCGR_PEP_ID=MMETSP0724-20121128/5832_1 /TAXON_ID=265536 /ORGANISM="Amphiprora sp., Strain CCMP467" /LENGTH=460 /DNA_ID=CAMNT_0008775579 /DNA_START=396 /DNA_END=1778 /DNA_ORIENTATION=+
MVDEEVPSQPQQQQSQHQHCPLYVAATRQHVGKTTTSLALLSGLQKRAGSQVGFIKPVGQVTLTVNDETTGQAIECDKDAVLVKQHFQLDHLSYRDMSPVLIPKGYTKDYLDGKILLREQRTQVERAYQNILQNSNHGVVLCEGTGHVAVGSVVDASNARVASWLGARMVLVANAGLGNCLDELDLNRVYCQEANVDIAGVIVNKCRPDKYEQTKRYLSQALDTKRWGHVPLLGLIPDRPFLGCPAIHDLERLLEGSELVSGHDDRFRHYTVQETYLVATSLEEFLKTVRQPRHDRTLYVCHASRNDILLGFLMEAQQREYHNKHHHHHHPHASNQPQQQQQPEQRPPWEAAMIVTGCDETPISPHVLEMIQQQQHKNNNQGRQRRLPPILMVPQSTVRVMDALHRYTPKLNFQDNHRVETAISHYESYIDFDLLLRRLLRVDHSAAAAEQQQQQQQQEQ